MSVAIRNYEHALKLVFQVELEYAVRCDVIEGPEDTRLPAHFPAR
jgi:hypothetical protein